MTPRWGHCKITAPGPLGYFCFTTKVPKNVPKPTVLDSLERHPMGDAHYGGIFVLRSSCGLSGLNRTCSRVSGEAATRRFVFEGFQICWGAAVLSFWWPTSTLRITGDGCAVRREAAQQQAQPIEPVGSRRSPAHQRRHEGRTNPGIVGGQTKRHIGDSQGGGAP